MQRSIWQLIHLQTAEGRLEYARRPDADEIMVSGSKPQEEGAGLLRRAFQRRWTSPISSLTRVIPMTFTAMTAADQNNTYLFMLASRNHTRAKEAYSRKNRQTSSRQCDIEFLGNVHSPECCVL